MGFIYRRFREPTNGVGRESIYDSQAVAAAAESYLGRLRALAPGAQLVIDKTNNNYLYLGLIALMFPHAKIVNVTRDYRDVALSLYFSDFAFMWNGLGRKRPPLEFSFDFDTIVHVINDYSKIMSHWDVVIPTPIFEMKYEKLVTNFDGVVRDLLAFIGVDWHPNLSTFYYTKRIVDNSNAWSVRRPLYETSIGKWAQYQAYISGFDSIRSK
jgi:hypothetical protein